MYYKRRSFWQSAARLSKTGGVMKLITYNGVVTLRSKDQAKKFGKKLYMHLSKGGKVVVTPELIRRLFEERRELVNTDAAEMEQHAAEMANITSAHATAGLFDDKGHEVEVFLSFLICTSLLFFLNKKNDDIKNITDIKVWIKNE